MIISHRYKYLFIELPMTGSTAIRAELRENYHGTPILQKHATYYDFLKVANAEEREYFVFSGIRNPLDQTVSHYFKFKTNHRDQFTRPPKPGQPKKSLVFRLAYHISHYKRYQYIRDSEADFATFFLKFYTIPYNNWSSMAHQRFDGVIRFEHLEEDFANVLKLMGIEQKRPLPTKNKTKQKVEDFWQYYDTPQMQQRARRVFGPFMEIWNYQFPPEWGDFSLSKWQRAEFAFYNSFRNIYWRYLRRPPISQTSVPLEEARRLALE